MERELAESSAFYAVVLPNIADITDQHIYLLQNGRRYTKKQKIGEGIITELVTIEEKEYAVLDIAVLPPTGRRN